MKTMLKILVSAAFLVSVLSMNMWAGTRQVPATLDLREHAEASIDFLMRTPDPDQDMLPYFWTFFASDPAELRHNHWDYCENPGRNLYALVCVRQITGSLRGQEAERAFERWIYRTMTGGNGLCWRPAYSPFARAGGKAEMNLWDNRSCFQGLLSLYMAYREPAVREKLEGMLDGLEVLALRRGDCMFFEREAILEDHVKDPGHEPRVGQHSSGWITPLVKYHQVTGSTRALEMARGLANFVVDYQHTSVEEGETLGISNVHGALYAVAGVIRAAQVTGDRAHIEWAKRMVDYASGELASDFGWVQEMESREWMDPEDTESCEFCAVVDMVQCALLLAESGYPEYWDLVDRYVRNYYVEGHILDTSWMKSTKEREPTVASSWTDVPSRVRGCFVGWGDPNDLVDPTARVQNAIQNCCGPHGAWGLFLIWHRMVTFSEQEGVRVHLALNKLTPWCRVESWIPYNGRVEVTMLRDGPLSVRVPLHTDASRAECFVDGRRVRAATEGGYVRFPELRRFQVARVEFPLPLEKRKERVDGVDYMVEWKGNTVIGIDPPGRVAPLFERERFRADTAPVKEEFEPDYRPEIDRALHEIDW